ncbi:MAG: DUF1573 domain-containing protein [Bacteroidota bacterium]
MIDVKSSIPILRCRLSLFFPIALLVLTSAFSQPKIVVVEGTTFDFGKVEEGNTVTKTLTLKNTGSDSLIISNVSTSCGCTVAKSSARNLAPGDSAALTIAFYTKDVVGTSVKRQVFVRSNDSTQSTVTITMVATILRFIETEPKYINFGAVSLGSTVKRSVVLRNMRDTVIKLLSVSTPDAQIAGRLARGRLDSHGETRLLVSLRPVRVGKVAGKIEIATDNPHIPEISISYIASVRK